MYTCSKCGKEAIVDHTNLPLYSCDCVGATLHANVSGEIHGFGGVREVKEQNNNLTEEGAMIIRNTAFALIAMEIFKNGKDNLYARDIVIKDSPTGREFTLNLTIK